MRVSFFFLLCILYFIMFMKKEMTTIPSMEECGWVQVGQPIDSFGAFGGAWDP
jgi:hypothetical protein